MFVVWYKRKRKEREKERKIPAAAQKIYEE
jgi:hypothetical protein